MTNKEAKDIINKIRYKYTFKCNKNSLKIVKAFNMAIEALSEQYMGCHGCRHYDSLQTSVICYDCSRAYKDRYEE